MHSISAGGIGGMGGGGASVIVGGKGGWGGGASPGGLGGNGSSSSERSKHSTTFSLLPSFSSLFRFSSASFSRSSLGTGFQLPSCSRMISFSSSGKSFDSRV